MFEALKTAAPEGLRYVSLNLEDGVSFIHIAVVDDELESNPLAKLESFKEFTAQIRERCEEPPAPVSASIVGNYRAIAE